MLLVAVTTATAAAVRAVLPVPDLAVLYLLPVMIAALRFGQGPALLAAALGVLSYDFFLVPPFFTLAVADARYFLTFAMMFGVGALLSKLTQRIRQQEQDAVVREERTAALYALTRDLGAADDVASAAAVIADHAAGVFFATSFVLCVSADGVLETMAASPREATLSANDVDVAHCACDRRQLAGLGTETRPESPTMVCPLAIGTVALGVLALQPRTGVPLRVEQREFLEAFGRQAAFALERAHLSEKARTAALKAKTEELRSSLLSAVSHDLRTPLAAITGAATSLRDDDALALSARAELLDTICDEADRLERLVANLLDMTRLASGPVALKREWVPLEEMVGSALTRLEKKLADRAVKIDLPDDLPLLSVDPVLFEQVFLNLFENAAKYAPPRSPVEIFARAESDHLVIEVRDRGPGLSPGTADRVFEKFYRGTHAGASGVGLGLPICKAIVESHGGTIEAKSRGGGGAVLRIRMPLAGSVPSVHPGIEEELGT